MALGWDIYVSIICLLAITAVYAVTGGLKAVIYVEGVQTVIMVAGGFILLILSMQEVISSNKSLHTLPYVLSYVHLK